MALFFSGTILPDPVAAALIGGIGGSILTAILASVREWVARYRQVRAVRTLITCEIDHNLRLLSSFWEEWEVGELQRELQRESWDEAKIAAGEQYISPLFVVPTLPTWRSAAFISQMAMLPIAIPGKISSVYEFHTRLERLQTLYLAVGSLEKKLRDRALQPRDPHLPRGSSFAKVMQSRDYRAESLKLQAELREVVKQLQAEGNPLIQASQAG